MGPSSEIGGVNIDKPKKVKSSDNLLFEFAREQAKEPSLTDWRKELKRKLAEAQEKKGRPDKRSSQSNLQATLPSTLRPEIKRTVVDPQPIAGAHYDIHKSLRDFEASMQSVAPKSRYASPARNLKTTPIQTELPRTSPVRPSAQAVALSKPFKDKSGSPEWIVGKSILLTRTLSGLVDLLIVAGCSALFLGVSMSFGNIDVMSHSFRSAVWASLLFFQIFYSLYFLGTVRRTVGMMLTGLKVVNEQAEEVRFHQLVLRTLFFFISWALAMLGLLWGLWDRRSRCLHDFLSRTIVVRC
ncbi:MAG: RDD family protein [Acidobacteria bacterium]|nr:RDD family protein [Acidobacteriota bacterium]